MISPLSLGYFVLVLASDESYLHASLHALLIYRIKPEQSNKTKPILAMMMFVLYSDKKL